LVGCILEGAQGQRRPAGHLRAGQCADPLLDSVTFDNYFRSICATREDEAVGLAAGAWMGGMKSVVMMQTSGFALIRIRFMQGLGTSRGGALDT
jgi:hypothetical protein